MSWEIMKTVWKLCPGISKAAVDFGILPSKVLYVPPIQNFDWVMKERQL